MKIQRLVRTAALAAAVFFALSGTAGARIELISATASWDFLHPTDGVNPVTADPDFATTWYKNDGNYNGVPFTTGKPAPYSYGGVDYIGNTGTLIGKNGTVTAPDSGKRYTAYFKKDFTTASNFGDIVLEMMVDDGAVVYIDGVERTRVNMTGTVASRPNATGDAYTMLADGAVDETVATGLLPPISLGTLAAGTHTIAISVHNADATSSDLGLYVRLLGPPPVMKTTFGGVSTDIAPINDFSGWRGTGTSAYGFRMNNADGTVHTIQSEPIDLLAVGEAYFAMEIYCYETSPDSNFETTDEFSAKLVLTLDDDSQMDLLLTPADLDTDMDGKLTGDEFNPGLLTAPASVAVGRQLRAVIPANAKSASLVINGLNDSTSETFRLGGATISDVPLDSDEDGDGVNLAAELFSGTNPADKSSAFVMTEVSYEFDNTLVPPAWVFNNTFPGVAGKLYAAETSTDGGASWELLGFVSPVNSGPFTAYIDLGATPVERYFVRLRCVP